MPNLEFAFRACGKARVKARVGRTLGHTANLVALKCGAMVSYTLCTNCSSRALSAPPSRTPLAAHPSGPLHPTEPPGVSPLILSPESDSEAIGPVETEGRGLLRGLLRFPGGKGAVLVAAEVQPEESLGGVPGGSEGGSEGFEPPAAAAAAAASAAAFRVGGRVEAWLSQQSG